MRQYSKISPSIWTGKTAKAIRGNLEAIVVQSYLLTSPMATMTGVYYCPILYICSDTGLSREGAMNGLKVLIDEGFCFYDWNREWVFVKNMARFQVAEELKPNDKRVVQMKKDAANMPEPFKLLFFRQYNESFCLDKRFDQEELSCPIDAPSMPHRSQEQEQEQKQEPTLTNTLPSIEAMTSEKMPVCLCCEEKESASGLFQRFGQIPIDETKEVFNRSFEEDDSVAIDAPLREQMEVVQLEASGNLDDPKHIMSVVDMIVVAKCNGIRLTRNVKLEEIANARTITLELFGKCISKWRGTQTGIGYFMGILSNAAHDPTIFDDKPVAKKKKITAETITDGQAWKFAYELAHYHPFGSRFGKAGRGYDELIVRVAHELKDSERFELYRPYMVKLGLVEEEIKNDEATQA